MRPTDEGVEQFRQLYREVEGVDLNPDEARRMASQLLALYERLAAWLARRHSTHGQADDYPGSVGCPSESRCE